MIKNHKHPKNRIKLISLADVKDDLNEFDIKLWKISYLQDLKKNITLFFINVLQISFNYIQNI